MRSPATPPDHAQTLNASVLAQMRADILGCRLAPSERLRVETLRERYGMGASPIREALMRLEAEGLVDLEHNKGFRVSDVSLENLHDLMNTRIEIEGVALRWSLERGGLDWEANLLSSFHRLSRQTKIDPSTPDVISAAWWKEHANFHSALVAGCESPTLLSIRTRLFDQAERYVVLSILSKGPMRDDVDEHKQLMRAAVDRDIEKAIELNRMHINRTLQKVAASLADGRKAANARRSGKRPL
jgi:DNA-binding GntR family transcriptional regulator